MIVTNIDLFCSCSGHVMNMSFRDPQATSSYIVQGLYGIDADEIVTNFYGKGIDSGNDFYSMTIPKRELILRVALNPDYKQGQSVSSLRDALYRAISTGRTGEVELRFNNLSEEQARIKGFVKKFEAGHFNDVPEVQLTINCEKEPMLKAPDPVVLNPDPGTPREIIVNDPFSTAPHGAIFEYIFTANSTSFEMREKDSTDWSFELSPPQIFEDDEFLTNDTLRISSVGRERSVEIIRGIVVIQIADKITPLSVWPMIFPGDNSFWVDSAHNCVLSSVTHNYSFWGI